MYDKCINLLASLAGRDRTPALCFWGQLIFMIEKSFNSNGQFWLLIIKIDNGEVLFFKNNESHPFYWFLEPEWYDEFTQQHMAEKNWFTKSMADFITANTSIL